MMIRVVVMLLLPRPLHRAVLGLSTMLHVVRVSTTAAAMGIIEQFQGLIRDCSSQWICISNRSNLLVKRFGKCQRVSNNFKSTRYLTSSWNVQPHLWPGEKPGAFESVSWGVRPMDSTFPGRLTHLCAPPPLRLLAFCSGSYQPPPLQPHCGQDLHPQLLEAEKAIQATQ